MTLADKLDAIVVAVYDGQTDEVSEAWLTVACRHLVTNPDSSKYDDDIEFAYNYLGGSHVIC